MQIVQTKFLVSLALKLWKEQKKFCRSDVILLLGIFTSYKQKSLEII